MDTVSDDIFIAMFESEMSISEMAIKIGMSERNLYRKRASIEVKYGIKLLTKGSKTSNKIWPEYNNMVFDRKKPFDIVVVSDRHCEPSEKPPAFVVACQIIEKIQPAVLVVNGDWFDFADMSRHVKRSWEDRPKISDEIIAGTSDLNHIRELSPKSKLYFTLGNHDMRFDGKIAELLDNLEGIKGASLIDHIGKNWKLTTSLVVNDSLLIKHRFRQGVHAAWNNVLHCGVSVCTGHTHRCLVRPFTDFNGTRYAMESGCISDINSPVFAYTENNPKDWQPGLMVIHVDGNIITPDPVRLIQQSDHKKHNKALYQGIWYG